MTPTVTFHQQTLDEIRAVQRAYAWTMDPERRVKAATDQGRWFLRAPHSAPPPRPPGEAVRLPRAA